MASRLRPWALENLLEGGAAVFQEAEQQVLGADIFIAQFARFGLGGLQRFLEGRG